MILVGHSYGGCDARRLSIVRIFVKRMILIAGLGACWTTPPPRATTVAAPEPPPSPPEPRRELDPSELRAMLDKDWTHAIDPAAGVVTFDVGAPTPFHTWCLPRGAELIKYEALSFAAELTRHETEDKEALVCTSLERDVVECHAEGLRPHFRFVWRDGRFVLASIAHYTGVLSRADAARYEAERNHRRCEPGP